MTVVAIDTLKVAQKLQDAGFSRKQAGGAAEVLAEVLDDRAGKDAVAEAVDTLGRALDRRLSTLEKGQAELQAGQTELRKDVTELRGDVTGLRGDVTELRAGQAVLMENQLETNRALAAILAHMGLAKPT